MTEFKLIISAKSVSDLKKKLQETYAQLFDCSIEGSVSVADAQAAIEGKRKSAGKPSGKKSKSAPARRGRKPNWLKEEEAKAAEPPEVAEPANRPIMDEFDARLAAERQGAEEEEETDVIDIDNLLDEAEEQGEADEVAPPTSAKQPSKKAVEEIATKLYHARKQKGENGLKALKAVLASYNVSKIEELNAGDYSSFIQKCQSLI